MLTDSQTGFWLCYVAFSQLWFWPNVLRIQSTAHILCPVLKNWLCLFYLNHPSIKTRQQWNYNICFTGTWFSASVDARERERKKKHLLTWRAWEGIWTIQWISEGETGHRWPQHSSWPVRAFILETWEEVKDGGPGVHHVDKLPPIQTLVACPSPSLPSHLHLIPSLSLSFVCLLWLFHFLSEAQTWIWWRDMSWIKNLRN